MNIPTTYNIAISGTFDVENYGDLMFPIVAEHELRRRLGSVHLTRYSYLEKVAHSWPYDVTPLSRLNTELKNHDCLLIGGGHLIRFDKGVAQGYYPSDGETHHPTGYWLTPALAAANAGKPIFWNGPSASLGTPTWGAPLLRAALSMSEYVAVRDEQTAMEIRRIGYSGQCSIIPDTVFGLPDLLPLEEARVRAAPLLEQAGITGPYIVVQAKSELADIAKALVAHRGTQGLQILVVAIGPILGEHPSLITDAVPVAKSLNFWPAPLDIAALIAASAGTVAISLHLTITSLCYGLPILRYSRTRLTKYEFIEASKNVFLHGGGEEPLPEEYIAHLTARKPCMIAQQAKSVLDAHWEHIARSLAAARTSEKKQNHPDFFKIWNIAMSQAEVLAQDAAQLTSASQAEVTTLKESVIKQEQALNLLTQERKSYELLIAKQAQLETRIADAAHHHSMALSEHNAERERYNAKITTLTEELEALKQGLADVLNGNKAMQGALDAKTRELSEDQQQLEQVRQLLVERDTHIRNMLGSRSWRLTLPLRRGGTLVRRIRNKVLPKRIRHLHAPAPSAAEGLNSLPEAHDPEQAASIPIATLRDEPFDEAFYVDNYPDVASSGMDPYRHYVEFGKAEERLAVPPPLMLTENSAVTHEGRDYVLVVCHDATRTGAPILGWNICRELSKRYNVVALLLGGGDIAGHFAADCAVVAGPYDRAVRTPKAIGRAIAELNERFKPAFAIVNSLASRSVLRPLAEQYVPSVLLVHEFSKFHCYPDEIVDTLAWAGEVVFPARIVQQNARLERTEPAVRRSHIVPQGQSIIPADKTDDNIAARNKAAQQRSELIRQVLPLGDGPDRPFIVLGAGTIEYRKGVDLFIATAAKLKRMGTGRKILMVWVGRTYDNPEHRQYRAYLENQILSSNLEEDLIMLEETPQLDALYGIADLFYVSARLDPLPNVAIDAMVIGLPLLCFENATGVAEILSSAAATQDCVLPYLQVQAAAQAIVEISSSTERQEQISQACKFLAQTNFDLPEYVKKLESLAITATTATYQRRADEHALSTSEHFVRDFYQPRRSSDPQARAAHVYLKQSQSRIYIRKPAPGFDPLAYAEHLGLTSSEVDPYLHWLQSGQPAGRWQEPILNLAAADLEISPKLRIGVHIHAYYPDLLNGILERMELNKLECDYLISTPNADAAVEVENILANKAYRHRCFVRQTANRGRDIGPFFTGFKAELQNYDVVGHFHTKKSPHVTLSHLVPDWIEFLLENMIGGRCRSADAILSAFSKNRELGLVFADDPHLIGWDKNRSFAARLATKMHLAPLTSGFFPFPVGTMFWARPRALSPLFDLNLQWEDYPGEPLPIDGSMLHALERLLPRVVEHTGFTHMATYVPGLTR